MPRLAVIHVSTRPARASDPISKWFVESARKEGSFEVDFIDLRELNLPFIDEPQHPRTGRYEHAHTKAWSERVKAADAFVFVSPEYNFGAPPTLLNALNFLYGEWLYKPASFVSYGGVSGGLRSVQMSKQVLTTLKVMPIPEAVVVPNFFADIKDGVFQANEHHEQSADAMLKELARWSEALAPLRS